MKSLTQENAVDLPNVGVSSYIHDGGQGKICTACQKYESVSPCDVVFFLKAWSQIYAQIIHIEHCRN